ncbi:hypothetical protein ILYODFUR_007257 [Ilyodon furcidens]|uniref:Uncharacterized protein n=1 Tax=Ilyodon furcidens TaxID=33524 RepID=A0ABV0T785_9TELE
MSSVNCTKRLATSQGNSSNLLQHNQVVQWEELKKATTAQSKAQGRTGLRKQQYISRVNQDQKPCSESSGQPRTELALLTSWFSLFLSRFVLPGAQQTTA